MSILASLLPARWVGPRDLLRDRGEVYALRLYDAYYDGHRIEGIPGTIPDQRRAQRMTLEAARYMLQNDPMFRGYTIALVGPL